MFNMGQANCTCGKPTLYSQPYCSTCHEEQRKRHSNGDRQDQQQPHTPPPTTITSPITPKRPSASTALTRAFALEEDQPVLFPSHFYRTPTRSLSRPTRTPQSSPESPVPARHSADMTRTPPGGVEARERSYSPMAAGFARLSVKDRQLAGPPGSPQCRGRVPSSASGSNDLGIRMFDGPA